jgi:hypothetical protein
LWFLEQHRDHRRGIDDDHASSPDAASHSARLTGRVSLAARRRSDRAASRAGKSPAASRRACSRSSRSRSAVVTAWVMVSPVSFASAREVVGLVGFDAERHNRTPPF